MALKEKLCERCKLPRIMTPRARYCPICSPIVAAERKAAYMPGYRQRKKAEKAAKMAKLKD